MRWLPTRREEKYKATQAFDTFFVRAGNVRAAGLVFAGTSWLIVSRFALTNPVLILAWLAVASYCCFITASSRVPDRT